jgi:hypothetical protein
MKDDVQIYSVMLEGIDASMGFGGASALSPATQQTDNIHRIQSCLGRNKTTFDEFNVVLDRT